MMSVTISQLASIKYTRGFLLPAVIAKAHLRLAPNEPGSSMTASHPPPIHLQPRPYPDASHVSIIDSCSARAIKPCWKDAVIGPANAARKLWNDSRMDQGQSGLDPRPHVPRPRGLPRHHT